MQKYLFLLGLALTVAGLVAGLLTAQWLPIPSILLALGAILITFYIGVFLSRHRSFWQKRSTQTSANAVIATVAVIVILGFVNFLAARYPLRLDLTENQLFTLSKQTQQIVANLPKSLKVWVFQRTPNPNEKELLENYRRYGDNFSFEFVDPQLQIEPARRFGVTEFGEVHIEYGDKKQLVQTLRPEQSLSEVTLTNAIVKVQRDRSPVVYFLQGHGEVALEQEEGSLSAAVKSLEEKGFTTQMLNLSQLSQIPDNASAVIVAGAKRKLFAGEVQALQDYLSAGGSLLLLIDPQTDPGLESLLEEWNVQLDESVVVDASGFGSAVGLGPLTPLITTYTDHPITENFSGGISVYPLARTVDFDDDDQENIAGEPLLITSEQSWAETEFNQQENAQVEFNPERDRSGPLNLGVALSRPIKEDKAQSEKQTEEEATDSPVSEEKVDTNSEADNEQVTEEASANSETNKQPEARLIVIGNSTFATNGWFEQQLNGDVFLNSVTWLVNDDEQALSISPKEPTNRRLNFTPVHAGVLTWLALVIMPLLGFITAGVVWWRRR